MKARDTERRNGLQVLLDKHYNGEVDIYWNVARPFLILRNTNRLVIPRPSLMEYLQLIKAGKFKPDVSVFEASIRFLQAGKKDS